MMRIGHEGIRPHIEAIKVWDPAAEETGFLEHFDPTWIEIIQIDGKDVGYIKIETRSDCEYLDGIYLASHCQGQGIGGAVLRQKLAALTGGRVTRLRVYKTNPAQALYARLGFVSIEETAHAVVMRYRAAPIK